MCGRCPAFYFANEPYIVKLVPSNLTVLSMSELDLSKNKAYFADITRKIDAIENPGANQGYQYLDQDGYGEVDGTSGVIMIPQSTEAYDPTVSIPSLDIDGINDRLPSIEINRIDGVVSLYNELNRTYGLKFDSEKISDIASTFKAIVDPIQKEVFEVYLREYIDRLRLACINQLGNTVYSLIHKLTSEETIRSLTISERVALLDRLFEYMDRVNNMVSYLPKGDTKTELRELAQRADEESGESGSGKPERNRAVESYVLSLLKNRNDSQSK